MKINFNEHDRGFSFAYLSTLAKSTKEQHGSVREMREERTTNTEQGTRFLYSYGKGEPQKIAL